MTFCSWMHKGKPLRQLRLSIWIPKLSKNDYVFRGASPISFSTHSLGNSSSQTDMLFYGNMLPSPGPTWNCKINWLAQKQQDNPSHIVLWVPDTRNKMTVELAIQYLGQFRTVSLLTSFSSPNILKRLKLLFYNTYKLYNKTYKLYNMLDKQVKRGKPCPDHSLFLAYTQLSYNE